MIYSHFGFACPSMFCSVLNKINTRKSKKCSLQYPGPIRALSLWYTNCLIQIWRRELFSYLKMAGKYLKLPMLWGYQPKSFHTGTTVGIFLFHLLLFLPSSHHSPSVSTKHLRWLLTCLLFHFIIMSHAHLMAIWPLLPISFSYVKELVTHWTPQCLFSHWGISSFVIWLLLSLLIYNSISILLLGTTNIFSVCSPTEVISILLLAFRLPCCCYNNNYNFHGCVNPPSALHGKHCILTSDVIEELQELIQESKLYLDEIGEWLALFHNIQISTTALHDNLWDLGISRKIMIRAAAEQDDQLCAEWMYDFLVTYCAEQMIVLDESSKDSKTLIHRMARHN